MQASKGDINIKNRLSNSVEEGTGGMTLREYHCNMDITICKTDDQCKFDA